jgi:hypothetical protein
MGIAYMIRDDILENSINYVLLRCHKNVSLYQMTNNNNNLKKNEAELRGLKRKLLNLENNNKKNDNNLKNNNNSRNKNVATWLNRVMSPGNKTNIKPSKRAYLKTNVGKNGKIFHVYDRNGLKNYLAYSHFIGVNAERPSPLTKRPFKLSNIKTYPPKPVVKARRGTKRKRSESPTTTRRQRR